MAIGLPSHAFQDQLVHLPLPEFVNTYGMPRYREINLPFAAATFPFLFGVMYGDIGHGSLLSLGALYLRPQKENERKRLPDDMLYNVYAARYMLLGMGLCAVYCGLVYNDYFSLGPHLFGTRYEFSDSGKAASHGSSGEGKSGADSGGDGGGGGPSNGDKAVF